MNAFQNAEPQPCACVRPHAPTGFAHDRADFVLRVFVFLPLVLLTLLFGGARPWIWQAVSGLVFLGIGTWSLRHELIAPQGEMRRLQAAALALLCVPLLQVAPLPAWLQAFLSPVRAQWSAGLREFGGIATTAISYDPLSTSMHLTWWAFLIAFASILYLSLQSGGRSHPAWLLHGLFLLAGFEALYGVLQALLPSLGVLWDVDAATGLAYQGYARGTFINRNHFAAFLGLLWPVLLAYLLILKSPRKMERILGTRERAQVLVQKKAFGVFCLGLVVLALVFSQSRGGILAALLSSTLLFAFAGFRRKRMAMVLAACWVIMLCYGTVIGFDGIAGRFSQIGQGAAGRFDLWKDGWTAVLDHPLTGTGLGTYPTVSRAYQNALDPGQRAKHAHNDYLEAAVEIGLPAAGILTLCIWGLWWRQAILLWRGRESMDQDRLALAAGTLAALGGYLLHAWTEFNNAIPANHLTAVMVAVLHFHIAGTDDAAFRETPRNSAT